LVTAVNQFDATDEGKANIILFFTDGDATAGITDTPGIIDAVQNAVDAVGTSIFMYPLGIGSGANQQLLTALAQAHNGESGFINPANLESSVSEFFLSINNPVLLNTEITFEPNIISQVYPAPYPNLYQGRQLIVSGRYQQAATVNMHVTGQAFNVPVSYDFAVTLAATEDPSKSILPKIWAKQKIESLGVQYYLASSNQEAYAFQEEIDSVSACYEVVSVDFNSFGDEVDNSGSSSGSFDSQTSLELVGDSQSKLFVELSPNPFTDQMTVKLFNLVSSSDFLQVRLYDLQGRLIQEQNVAVDDSTIELTFSRLAKLTPGIYLVSIEINGQKTHVKVIKE